MSLSLDRASGGAVPPGWTCHRFESIGSTMDAARDMARVDAPDRTLVRADEQRGGRGRHGRSWVSEPGNLYMTVLLRETRPLADCAQLSFAAALALDGAMDMPGVTLKWPNDVLIRGRKIAGILLEAGGEAASPWILIGMGINVAHHPADTPYPVTHLAAEGGESTLDALCHRVLEGIDRWRGIWHKQGAQELHRAWLAKAHGRGERLRVRLPDRELHGCFEALDDSGALLLRDDEGKCHRITAGDVFFT